jgi:hypothetical protein
MTFHICIYFLFMFSFYVFWSLRLIIELCNIIFSNFQYLALLYYYIPFRVFSASVLNLMVFFPT